MISIEDRKVIYSGQVVLGPRESKFRVDLDHNQSVEIRFRDDGTGKPSAAVKHEPTGFVIGLAYFGNPLGMTVEGTIPGGLLGRSLRYRIVVHNIGDAMPTRLVALTVSEDRQW